MTGVVLAIDSELFAISDKAGHYSISGVPPGKYLVRVWYENARPEALQELQRTVTIEGGNRALPTISVPVIAQVRPEHKNKYNQDYDPDALKTGLLGSSSACQLTNARAMVGETFQGQAKSRRDEYANGN